MSRWLLYGDGGQDMSRKVDPIVLGLADRRRESGMTQREVARRIGVDHKTVSNWEAGVSSPTVAFAAAYAMTVGTRLEFAAPPRTGAVLELRAGDRVVLCFDGEVGLEDAERDEKVLRQRVPGVEFTLVGNVKAVLHQAGEAA